jgi:hypothetical protein
MTIGNGRMVDGKVIEKCGDCVFYSRFWYCCRMTDRIIEDEKEIDIRCPLKGESDDPK